MHEYRPYVGTHYGEKPYEEVEAIVHKALKSGVNYIDTAPWYGSNRSEELLGRALKSVPRKAYFLSTKACNYGYLRDPLPENYNYNAARAVQSVEESLQRLGVGHIDLLYIHDFSFVYSLDQLLEHTIPALMKLKEEGKIRYLGISSYGLKVAKKLIELAPKGSIDVFMSNNRCYVMDKGINAVRSSSRGCLSGVCKLDLFDYLDFFDGRGVGVVNASPAGSGLIARNNTPPWHPAPPLLKEAAHAAVEFCHEKGVNLGWRTSCIIKTNLYKQVHDIASLSAKWCYNHPRISTTLCSITSREILEASLSAATNRLTAEEEALLAQVERRFVRPLPVWNWLNLTETPYWVEMRKNGWEQHKG